MNKYFSSILLVGLFFVYAHAEASNRLFISCKKQSGGFIAFAGSPQDLTGKDGIQPFICTVKENYPAIQVNSYDCEAYQGAAYLRVKAPYNVGRNPNGMLYSLKIQYVSEDDFDQVLKTETAICRIKNL